MNSPLQTPVALLIYKRPTLTQRVFERIAAARPRQLFIVADGPRTAAEAPACEATRAIVSAVDWECDVLTNFAEINMGLKQRVSSGLDWIFEQVEQAIILEDDCVPDPTFFRFCAELLDYYRDDPRVMHIGGSNFLPGQLSVEASYVFTRYIYVWGWATWRRAWQQFDGKMRLWHDAAVRSRMLQQFSSPKERAFWEGIWNQCSTGQINTWDYPWVLTCMNTGGLGVVPVKNLVTNIGFDSDATHTKVQGAFGSVPSAAMSFPLVHPKVVARNRGVDLRLSELVLYKPPLHLRAYLRLKRMVDSVLRNRGEGNVKIR